MVNTYQRSKKRFASSRGAWMNIAKSTGLRPKQVKAMHTQTHWIWKTK